MAQPVRDQAERLGRAAGAVAVLFYGSNLRTGSLEGVLDYYVLLPGAVERGIWPRVSYHEWDAGGQGLRAKVATMNIGTFQAAASGQLVDTTIWARFVQPCALAWGADENAHRQVVEALAAAAMTAARLAAALGPSSGPPDAFWRALFRATYRAEFRVEAAGREDSILTANQTHFEGLLPLALEAGGIAFTQQAGEIAPRLGPGDAQRIRRWWARRRRLGKPYNLLRLIRASTTFEGAARYAAWKIQRHTGVAVTLTPWRERHPLLAAPGVLWQVWRARKRAR
ncbi:MAG: hypothetical protein H6915_07640 [Novosphingobium sp.]|nr:hypothetical protein [Novosphingobium sp.]MCP5379799.1 hypothetical protein [Novosphingobium sp.]MCP5389625.1 hypothetical protein [Novosphingobium sp.]